MTLQDWIDKRKITACPICGCSLIFNDYNESICVNSKCNYSTIKNKKKFKRT